MVRIVSRANARARQPFDQRCDRHEHGQPGEAEEQFTGLRESLTTIVRHRLGVRTPGGPGHAPLQCDEHPYSTAAMRKHAIAVWEPKAREERIEKETADDPVRGSWFATASVDDGPPRSITKQTSPRGRRYAGRHTTDRPQQHR